MPIRARPRGTRHDLYSRNPSNRSHMAGMKLCPWRKMRSYRVASAWLVTNAPAPAPACRKVTIDIKERHADEDGAGFQNSGGDEAQRGRFVLLLEHREQHDGGADAGESHDDLQDTADDGGSVRASAEDVIHTLYWTIDKEGWDRDKGEQVEHARDKRGLPQ